MSFVELFALAATILQYASRAYQKHCRYRMSRKTEQAFMVIFVLCIIQQDILKSVCTRCVYSCLLYDTGLRTTAARQDKSPGGGSNVITMILDSTPKHPQLSCSKLALPKLQ